MVVELQVLAQPAQLPDAEAPGFEHGHRPVPDQVEQSSYPSQRGEGLPGGGRVDRLATGGHHRSSGWIGLCRPERRTAPHRHPDLQRQLDGVLVQAAEQPGREQFLHARRDGTTVGQRTDRRAGDQPFEHGSGVSAQPAQGGAHRSRVQARPFPETGRVGRQHVHHRAGDAQSGISDQT